MSHNICILPNTIHLIIQFDRWDEIQLANAKIIPTTPAKLRDELTRLSCSTGIPALLENFADGRPRIVFCTEHLEVGCGLSKMEDAYTLAFVNPLSVRRRSQLARQAVLVITRHPTPWSIIKNPNELRTIPNPQTGYKEINTIWDQISSSLKANGETDPLSPVHYKFLSDIENLVDIAYEAELDQQNKESVVILDIEPVAVERYARDVYRLRVKSHKFKVGDSVLVGKDAPGDTGMGFIGSVIETLPNALTLSFHNQPDTSLFDGLHWIKPFSSNKQHEIKRSALRTLRDGSSANPHLLNIIVDGQFAETPKPLVEIEPAPNFNDSQRLAIGYADDVPDLMLVVGPPGTGKTKCISEMAKRHAKLGKRVLVTSKNNKAVDNVLEKLEGLEALRIGREEKISVEIQSLLIDVKARELQQQIIVKTKPLITNLDRVIQLWPKIDIALGDLEQASGQWQEAIQEYEIQVRENNEWEEEVYKTYQPVLERIQRVVNARDKELKNIGSEIEATSRRKSRLLTYAKIPVIGIFIKSTIENYQIFIQNLEIQRSQIIQKRDRSWEDSRRVFESYKNQITESTEALERKNKLKIRLSKVHDSEKTAMEFLYHLNRIFTNLQDSPPNNQVTSPQGIPAFIREMRSWHKRISCRHELLHEWHDMLGTRHQALYPSLVRTADVVGATCIGIATDARFESLDFDLVIADEAGQIQVMDLLVPLVKANRAVLVGDHKQLPPIVDEGVRARLDAENTEQWEWLTKSLFELIHARPTVPANREVMLDTQYRIPKVVADLISLSFYENRYKTGHTRAHADPFFNQPFVFIDTKESPKRRESPSKGKEGLESGYANKLEADLITSLVLAYQKHGLSWGVIVPYNKQVELIHQKLQQYFSEEELKDLVATVDSFQGKERETIIYGFTRSNEGGRIGFQSELRRLNVGLTRASNQLIVIGDSSFLTSTIEAEFSAFIRKLLEIAGSLEGAYCHARQIRQLIPS